MSRITRTAAALAALSIAGLALAGCNSGASPGHGRGDGPVAQREGLTNIDPNKGVRGINNTSASIIEFPDTYFNVAFQCNGADGIYSNTRSAGVPVVVPNDPQCAP